MTNYTNDYTMPNFLVIGASKAGTTSLYEYLKQHPQVYMSPLKELRFFALEGENPNFCGPWDDIEIERYSITSLDAYKHQFLGVTDEIAIGEASPWYLYSEKAAINIKKYLPKAKLIAILRDPVDRAYSHFSMHVLNGREPLTEFTQAIQEEKNRISNNWSWSWHYVQRGLYYQQLSRYFSLFEDEKIKIYLYEDLKTNAIKVVQDIFQFLGVETSFIPDLSLQHNVSGIPKNKILHSFLTKKNPVKTLLKSLIPDQYRHQLSTKLTTKNLAKSTVSLEVRQELIKVYRDDILQLQDLIDRDLSAWLH